MIGRLLGRNHQNTTARDAHLADDPVDELIETIGATIQYPNSYWMVCFAFSGARQDTSAIAALCDHNRLGISQLAPLLEAWMPPPSF